MSERVKASQRVLEGESVREGHLSMSERYESMSERIEVFENRVWRRKGVCSVKGFGFGCRMINQWKE